MTPAARFILSYCGICATLLFCSTQACNGTGSDPTVTHTLIRAFSGEALTVAWPGTVPKPKKDLIEFRLFAQGASLLAPVRSGTVELTRSRAAVFDVTLPATNGPQEFVLKAWAQADKQHGESVPMLLASIAAQPRELPGEIQRLVGKSVVVSRIGVAASLCHLVGSLAIHEGQPGGTGPALIWVEHPDPELDRGEAGPDSLWVVFSSSSDHPAEPAETAGGAWWIECPSAWSAEILTDPTADSSLATLIRTGASRAFPGH